MSGPDPGPVRARPGPGYLCWLGVPSLWFMLGSLEPAGLPYWVVQGGGSEGPTGPLILPHQSATLTVTPQIPGVARQDTLPTGPLPPERLKDQTPG